MQNKASRRRQQGSASPGRLFASEPTRRQQWANKAVHEILAGYPPGKAPPLKVLEVLLELFNTLHTSLDKTVSHKTRQERAQFLRRFFRDLKAKAGFNTIPDPRNLGQKHIHAMVQVWQQAHLAPATIQTYLSFLRGLGMWMGKHGFVRGPAHYGLSVEEYQRHEYAQRDKSWSAAGIDIEELIERVCVCDRYVGASLRLINAMGLRRKESIQFRPFEHVLPFSETGLPIEDKAADRYVRIKGKGGRVRFIPLDSSARLAAVEFAQGLVCNRDAYLGDPANDLKKNLRRFDYVLEKFGISFRELGVTAHGLRHEALIEHFQSLTGQPPPVRGGMGLPREVDQFARKAVSELAGHARIRASGAYIGQSVVLCTKVSTPTVSVDLRDSDDSP
ncbi:phage integrase N-terminal domain-containing protein [Polaromonas sp.]|jgi:site-specific recombinase XerC|uniref:phage integrase N-terminal domain-containing protein n=1 Tax=Polaromonas sp. TaxID=1869339 RepID=UPI002489377E|nr:phage integrase N-terminal domain-containing protein [Polaromonas sp.]MDI1339518.1 phage integrase N-terminal domain-containing protein [Polaromonas sp.]